MSARPTRFVAPAFATVFAILALIFSLLTITSNKWAVKAEHSVTTGYWTSRNVLWTEYRSPFATCRAREVLLNNTTPEGTSTTTSALPTSTWAVDCYHFRPFGRNATSCEPQNVTGSDDPDGPSNIGDARLCQQIYYAGNFGITSTLFIGLGFLLTATMLIVTLVSPRSASSTNVAQMTSTSGGKPEQQQPSDGQQDAALDESPTSTAARPRQPLAIALYGNLALVIFLFIGFASGLISQFYGILGLIQSLPNQADYASSTGGGVSDTPWYQGVALSTYATLAWGFTAAAGTVAVMTWKLPDWTAWD
jgi:hypothetical protein